MMKKNIINLLLIFFLGGFGGVIFSNVVLPKLVVLDIFSDSSFLKQLKDQTVIINKTEEVSIEESEFLNGILKKNKMSLVSIRVSQGGRIISSGSGLVVSSDGFILTRAEVVLSDTDDISIEREGEIFSGKVYQRFNDKGLVLIQADVSGLPVISLSDLSEDRLGSKVILIGKKQGIDKEIDFVNVGVLKSIDGLILETNMKEQNPRHISGTPLIDLKGDVLGINFTNSGGYVFSVSSETIKEILR